MCIQQNTNKYNNMCRQQNTNKYNNTCRKQNTSNYNNFIFVKEYLHIYTLIYCPHQNFLNNNKTKTKWVKINK